MDYRKNSVVLNLFKESYVSVKFVVNNKVVFLLIKSDLLNIVFYLLFKLRLVVVF